MSNIAFYTQAATSSMCNNKVSKLFWNFGRPFMGLQTLHWFRAFQKVWCWCTSALEVFMLVHVLVVHITSVVHKQENKNSDQSCANLYSSTI